MGINLSDLIAESIIRDGIQYLKENPDVIDDVFSQLTKVYTSTKYGASELAKIKAFIQTKEIAVVHSFYEAAAKSPCYSIQLGAEAEAKERAHLGDFEADVRVDLTTPTELAPYVKVDPFTPTGYDPLTGRVSVDDAVDLDPVYPGYIWKDGSGDEFEILTGISNNVGSKYFFTTKLAEPNLTDPGQIKSFINYSQHELKGDTSAVNLLIGVHTKDALTTKYMYIMLKYIFKSRKKSLIKRGLINSSFSGSDFTRDLKYEGDQVFTRFFTLTGQVDDTWNSDNVELIDAIEIDARPVE